MSLENRLYSLIYIPSNLFYNVLCPKHCNIIFHFWRDLILIDWSCQSPSALPTNNCVSPSQWNSSFIFSFNFICFHFWSFSFIFFIWFNLISFDFIWLIEAVNHPQLCQLTIVFHRLNETLLSFFHLISFAFIFEAFLSFFSFDLIWFHLISFDWLKLSITNSFAN